MKFKAFLLLGLMITIICFLLKSYVLKKAVAIDDLTVYKMNFGGYERTYYVHFPPSEKMKSKVPILFNLHGGGGTAKGSVRITFGRFNELADKDGFIMVYPEAVQKSWNNGRKLDETKAWREDIDDVGFIVKIVETLEAKYKVDRKRIYTTGMSNGGFMSSRLLCERADLFRGGAILTASISTDFFPNCKPSQPIAVLLMNSTKDAIIPYDGGIIKFFGKERGSILSTDDYLAFWQEKNGCVSKKETIEIADKDGDGTSVSIESYEDCANRGALLLYKINGAGHT